MLKSITPHYFLLISCLTSAVLGICPSTHAQGIKLDTGLPKLKPWSTPDKKPQPIKTFQAPQRIEVIPEIQAAPGVSETSNQPSIILNPPGENLLTEERLQELTTPDIRNPVLTPPFRLPENSNEGRLHLAKSEILTKEVNGVTRYWMKGKLANLTNGWVKDVIVHYKIRDDFWILQSGHFPVSTECVTFGLQCLEFKFPLKQPGKLEITFVEWKYQDGSTGVSKGGIF